MALSCGQKPDHLSNKPNTDIPQHNRLPRDEGPSVLLNKAAAILNYKIADLKGCPRVAAADKDKRDIMIYLLWATGKYTNTRIGNLFWPHLFFDKSQGKYHKVKNCR
jgi:putative transposase